jgi:TetR/AcrR family transcriptional repressor of nem operon
MHSFPVRGTLFSKAFGMHKGEQTRQRIIEQAAPLFNQRGFAGASMQDIMEATGLEKGCIYRHFSSKQELAAEAFRYALQQAMEARTAHLAEIPNALDKLRQMVQTFAERPSPVPGGCPLMNTAADADDTNPELRDLARNGVRAWKNRIVAIIRAGIRRGEINPATNPASLANLIVATLEGALMIVRLEGSREAMKDAQGALACVLDAAAPAPTPSRRNAGKATS